MPRYLSPEWVRAFNAALAELDLTDAIAAAGTGSVTAASGTFTVAQVITEDAAASVRTVLTVDQGRISLEVDPTGSRPADVTMVLRHADALAMARGDLDPARALSTGRVRVRGELAVLVAGQAVLNAAAAALGGAWADLTDRDDTDDLDGSADLHE
jgi:hypothetical protein